MPTVQLKIGTDHRYEYRIGNAANTLAVDITGWAMSWMVKRHAYDLDAAAVLVKTTAAGGVTITGIFNETLTLNAQVARVTISDDDTAALLPNLYVYELKRTDAGFETPLSAGFLELDYAVHRA